MPLDLDRLAFFPIWPATEDGKCGCGNAACTSKPGKHPCFRWSDLRAGEKIAGPDGCNYGIATGSRSGLFVVDLDGADAVAWWAERQPDVATYRVRTARGWHLYFQAPDFPVKNSQGNAGGIAPNVDIRGEGGYVIAEGSVHVTGHVYVAADPDADVLPAPAWLLEWPGLRGRTRAEGGEGNENSPQPVDVGTPEGLARVRAGALASATWAPSIAGAGGSGALWGLALELVRKLCLPLPSCAELLTTVYNPRCVPPWSEEEIWHKLIGARDDSELPPPVPGPELDEEGWSSIWASMRASSKSLRPGHVPERRVHVDGHTYTFTPGKDINASANEPKARLLVDVANMLATHPDWDGSLQWDSFRGRLLAVDPPMRMDAETSGLSDADITHVRMWLECHGTLLQKGEAYDVIHSAAKRVSFHPVHEYLRACEVTPTGTRILDDAAAWLFGTTEPLAQECFKKTMVAAVRRVLDPGCQVDTMLVLTGKQGARKSTFVRELFGEEYTRSQMPDLESKDASLALQGFWGIELAELDKIMRAGNETVLEFLTRRIDDYRAPYARCESHAPRACVFIGTTNTSDFLRDSNGHRRYWPIIADKVDLTWLRANRDAMWGEAYRLALDPTYMHWFEDEAAISAIHDPFVSHDPWHEAVRKYIEGSKTVRSVDVYLHALEGKIIDFDKAKQMRLSDTLKRLGCTPKKLKGGSRYFKVPEELAGVVRKETSADRLASRPTG